jgi:hypothetical protein
VNIKNYLNNLTAMISLSLLSFLTSTTIMAQAWLGWVAKDQLFKTSTSIGSPELAFDPTITSGIE